MVLGTIKAFRQLLLPKKSSKKNRLRFLDIGFHGDRYLIEFVDAIMESCNAFIETGANVGSSLAYIAKRFPTAQCYSCEPDSTAFRHAINNTRSYKNVHLFNEMSQTFMKRMVDNKMRNLSGEVVFWLDAHDYGFKWPLQEEVEIITSHWEKAFVLIDDFLVPGLDCFGYDQYKGQICSFDFIKNSLNKNHEYRLYYPAYTERTSNFHPLRGWGLIEFGHSNELDLPPILKDKVSKTLVKT